MSTIKTTERLLKRACLINLVLPEGIAITPLLSGAHGLGKSAICRQVARDLGGESLTVEGGSLKEGEITGLPFAQTNPDGTKEVRFVPYYQTGRIQQLEKLIYEKAKAGFLGGRVKLLEDGSTVYTDSEGKHVIPAKSAYASVISGADNVFEFGTELPAHIKLELLKSKEIMPIVLFIDEMNRTDSQTMKELMNIVLTRTVNGYKYPWWVFIVSAINPCGQDSVYSTNDLDAAQLDRFLKIKVNADLTEWIDYAINKGINDDYVIALSTAEEIFQTKGKGYDDEAEDLQPTPRSHEICSYIYGSTELMNASGFFDADELAQAGEDVRQLIIGKLGARAGRTMLSNLRNRENYIDPADIITGKDKTVAPKLLEKISSMRTIARRILIRNVIKYIAKNSVKHFYDMPSKDAKVAENAKKVWTNVLSQVKSLLGVLDGATQLIFAKEAFGTNVALTDTKYEKFCKESLFKALGCTFSSDIVQQVAMTSNITNSGDIDKK